MKKNFHQPTIILKNSPSKFNSKSFKEKHSVTCNISQDSTNDIKQFHSNHIKNVSKIYEENIQNCLNINKYELNVDMLKSKLHKLNSLIPNMSTNKENYSQNSNLLEPMEVYKLKNSTAIYSERGLKRNYKSLSQFDNCNQPESGGGKLDHKGHTVISTTTNNNTSVKEIDDSNPFESTDKLSKSHRTAKSTTNKASVSQIDYYKASESIGKSIQNQLTTSNKPSVEKFDIKLKNYRTYSSNLEIQKVNDLVLQNLESSMDSSYEDLIEDILSYRDSSKFIEVTNKNKFKHHDCDYNILLKTDKNHYKYKSHIKVLNLSPKNISKKYNNQNNTAKRDIDYINFIKDINKNKFKSGAESYEISDGKNNSKTGQNSLRIDSNKKVLIMSGKKYKQEDYLNGIDKINIMTNMQAENNIIKMYKALEQDVDAVKKNLDFSEELLTKNIDIQYSQIESPFKISLSNINNIKTGEVKENETDKMITAKLSESNLSLSQNFSTTVSKKKVIFIEKSPSVFIYNNKKSLENITRFNLISKSNFTKKTIKIKPILKEKQSISYSDVDYLTDGLNSNNEDKEKLLALQQLNKLIKECEVEDFEDDNLMAKSKSARNFSNSNLNLNSKKVIKNRIFKRHSNSISEFHYNFSDFENKKKAFDDYENIKKKIGKVKIYSTNNIKDEKINNSKSNNINVTSKINIPSGKRNIKNNISETSTRPPQTNCSFKNNFTKKSDSQKMKIKPKNISVTTPRLK